MENAFVARFIGSKLCVWNCHSFFDDSTEGTVVEKQKKALQQLLEGHIDFILSYPRALFHKDPVNLLIFLFLSSQTGRYLNKNPASIIHTRRENAKLLIDRFKNFEIYDFISSIPKHVILTRLIRAISYAEAEANFTLLKETGVLKNILLVLRSPQGTPLVRPQ